MWLLFHIPYSTDFRPDCFYVCIILSRCLFFHWPKREGDITGLPHKKFWARGPCLILLCIIQILFFRISSFICCKNGSFTPLQILPQSGISSALIISLICVLLSHCDINLWGFCCWGHLHGTCILVSVGPSPPSDQILFLICFNFVVTRMKIVSSFCPLTLFSQGLGNL